MAVAIDIYLCSPDIEESGNIGDGADAPSLFLQKKGKTKMHKDLLERLKRVTGEEVSETAKGLIDGEMKQMIAVHPYTRDANFSRDRGKYIEGIHMLEGSLTNIVEGKKVVVNKGDLLLVNRYSGYEIIPGDEDNFAIRFAILPEFFDSASCIAGKDNKLADFFIKVLRENDEKGEFFHFKMGEMPQIRNLLENMTYSLLEPGSNRELINKATMAVIFLHLLENVHNAGMRMPNRYENMVAMLVLDYIEHHYKDGTLTEICEMIGLPMHALSRMIKRTTGFNYKELLQRKRIVKAVRLLCDTDMPINDIVRAVGYENNSYFHKVFRERYHMTPRDFRANKRMNRQIRL